MTEYNKLINDISNRKYSPLYLLHGDESYFGDKLIDHLKNNIINESSEEFDFKKIYAKKNDENQESEVIDFVRRFPLSCLLYTSDAADD